MYLVSTYRGGLGATSQQIVGTASSLAAPIGIHFAAPAVASLLGIAPAFAVPLVGAAIAGITIGIEAILNSGCGQSCIMTSNWANDAEKLLVQNIQKYFSMPAPRLESVRQLALQNFDSVMTYLAQQCGQPGLSTAGKNCIDDRKAGACTWRQTANSPLLAYPNEPQPGACWNWVNGYRDPIAMDSDVVPDSIGTAAAGLLSSAAETAGVQPWVLGVILAVVVGAVLL